VGLNEKLVDTVRSSDVVERGAPSLPADATTTAAPTRRREARAAGSRVASNGKWSPRKTLVFVIVVCGGFWALAALLARAFL
jgi:hypothetical protein